MTLDVKRKTRPRLANRSLVSGGSSSRNNGRNSSQDGQGEPMPSETANDSQDLDIDIIHIDPPDEPTSSLELVNNNASSIERLGANLDPFDTLPTKIHFSTLKLLEYCM